MASVRGAGRALAVEYTGFERAVYVVAAGQFVNVFGGGVVYRRNRPSASGPNREGEGRF